MQKLKKPITFETAFGTYVAEDLIGEGGAGRVYGGHSGDNAVVAIKLLAQDKASADKRRRFKNEIAFLARNKHSNIVSVIDHGVAAGDAVAGPFYVMRRYPGNLRERMRVGIEPANVLPLFAQVLDGVDAAHLLGVVHRDLKPENILYDEASTSAAIADFGIASFTDELLITLVETGDEQRLANFQYAAPEQRTAGRPVGAAADIYSLGLMLNEMFTRIVPHGTEYRTIGQAADRFAFLDPIVAQMLRQNPEERPRTVAELKALLQKNHAEFVSLQKISKLDGAVVAVSTVDEPLALEPPRLISVDWDKDRLTLQLDRSVDQQWVEALHRMPAYSSVMGKPPQVFQFRGSTAVVNATSHQVQSIVDYFKTWLPLASRNLKQMLEDAGMRDVAAKREQLRREQAEEQERLRVLRNVRI